MKDYRSKLSIDFLKRGPHSTKRKEPEAQNFLDEAVMLYGRKMLEHLAQSKQSSEHLHDIVKDQNIALRDALQVIDYLEKGGFIEIVAPDPVLGNHEIASTPRGRALVS